MKNRRRKSEVVRLRNERDFPHQVELALPAKGFRDVAQQIDAFHRERRIPVRRGRNRHKAKQLYIRFCFPDAATADAFRYRLSAMQAAGGHWIGGASGAKDLFVEAKARHSALYWLCYRHRNQIQLCHRAWGFAYSRSYACCP
jgi:hypothetical protein